MTLKNQSAFVFRAMASVLMLSVLTAGCLSAMAQDSVSYPVMLAVEDNNLSFTGNSNCAGSRPSGDVCVASRSSAEIIFSLGSGSEDWAFSKIEIRDPAANWADRLPANTAADFSQFDRNGQYQVSATEEGTLMIDDANSQALAVQYGIVVRNKLTGSELPSAYGVIDNDGGAPERQN